MISAHVSTTVFAQQATQHPPSAAPTDLALAGPPKPDLQLGIGDDDDDIAYDFNQENATTTSDAWTTNPFLGFVSGMANMALTLGHPVSFMSFGVLGSILTKTLILKDRLKNRRDKEKEYKDLVEFEKKLKDALAKLQPQLKPTMDKLEALQKMTEVFEHKYLENVAINPSTGALKTFESAGQFERWLKRSQGKAYQQEMLKRDPKWLDNYYKFKEGLIKKRDAILEDPKTKAGISQLQRELEPLEAEQRKLAERHNWDSELKSWRMAKTIKPASHNAGPGRFMVSDTGTDAETVSKTPREVRAQLSNHMDRCNVLSARLTEKSTDLNTEMSKWRNKVPAHALRPVDYGHKVLLAMGWGGAGWFATTLDYSGFNEGDTDLELFTWRFSPLMGTARILKSIAQQKQESMRAEQDRQAQANDLSARLANDPNFAPYLNSVYAAFHSMRERLKLDILNGTKDIPSTSFNFDTNIGAIEKEAVFKKHLIKSIAAASLEVKASTPTRTKALFQALQADGVIEGSLDAQEMLGKTVQNAVTRLFPNLTLVGGQEAFKYLSEGTVTDLMELIRKNLKEKVKSEAADAGNPSGNQVTNAVAPAPGASNTVVVPLPEIIQQTSQPATPSGGQ